MKVIIRYSLGVALWAGLIGVNLKAASLAKLKERPRAVIFVSTPADPSWQDFAVLAAQAASFDSGNGDQLFRIESTVIALDQAGTLPREVVDFLKRFQPHRTLHLGENPLPAKPGFGEHAELGCHSAQEAALILANTLWKTSKRVVICRDDDYASALMASTLAARLKAPLLFSGADGISKATQQAIQRLQPEEQVFVGKAPEGMKVTALPDFDSVARWVKKQGAPCDYLAVVNIRDRTSTKVRKLSLAAPAFAAGRKGMVLPIDMEFRWRELFKGQPIKGDLPKGIRSGAKPPVAGVMKFAEGEVPFVVGCGKTEKDFLLWLDLNGDGAYDAKGEGPFSRNFQMDLLGKPRLLDFAERYGPKRDLTVTTGNAEQVTRFLKDRYRAVGAPEFLCLIGFPDAIPQSILPYDHRADLTSDLPYGDLDQDLFSEIAVGRIIAENATFATLHACRTLRYNELVYKQPADSCWSNRAGLARWENTLGKYFENVGIDASAHHDKEDRPWVKPPKGDKKGEQAKSFGPESPLANVGFISHMAHSWWKELGETYHMDSETLLAPVVIESGGCLTANLDCEPEFRSVIARLFRNGAVSFCGQTRPGIAPQEQQRVEFWNAISAGMTIGEAHRHAQNSKAATCLMTGQLARGGDFYQLQIRSLFGDPAFKPSLPSAPASAPVKTTVDGDKLVVTGPQSWWVERIRVPEDWKLWADKPLHVVRGYGAYPQRQWCSEQYDKEEIYANVQMTTKQRVASIEQLQPLPAPLGYDGKQAVDEHADGSRTYHWRVRMIDFDQKAGTIINKADRVEFRVQYAQ